MPLNRESDLYGSTVVVSAGFALLLAAVATPVFFRSYGFAYAPPTSTAETASLAVEIQRKQRGVRLRQVNPFADDNTTPEKGIDIIAVHGLDTRSPETWEYKTQNGRKVNWLQDEHMLPAEVSNARIFTCDWPADLFGTLDAEEDTIHELALLLLAAVKGRPPATNDKPHRKDRPILFVASCLGGIILMKALVMASDEYLSVRNATRGIIFLATPFRGTSFEDVARWAEPGLRAWASVQGRRVTSLLDWVNSPTFKLTRLVSEFTQLCHNNNHQGFKVLTFYETSYTNLPAKVPLLSLLLPPSKKQLVSMRSAVLDCVPNPLRLDRSHVLMNKFQGPKTSDADYKLVVDSILDFVEDIRKGTPLEQANAWIRDKHYNKDRLRIERLSGNTLPMDQCYINLALVETPRDNDSKQRSGDDPLQSEHFSLAARLKIETPREDSQVKLSKLFEPRKQLDGQMKEPRRILIRGRAGVGKTTLCKKIVHDFVKKEMWSNLFASILWVPLRNLKTWRGPPYGLTEMLHQIYLQQRPDHASLASALRQHVEDSVSLGALFLLDGLDEISELLDEQHNPDLFRFLVDLLNRPNVIITTRPHVSLPHDFQKPDLELETIGFHSDQVEAYLKAVSTPIVSRNIHSFLQRSPLMRSLVRVPIQLDALCIVWDETLDIDRLQTMTQVYQAIVKRLWKKDIKRLKESQPHVEAMSSQEIENHVMEEIQLLESLAFSGMCSNLIEFQSVHRDAVCDFARPTRTSLPVYETLGRLSFLRTSDGSADPATRTHHFLHLTFQEYFAAKYFVQMWTNKKTLQYVDLNRPKKRCCEISAKDFLRKSKYTGRYDIMWRFVAGILSEEGEDEMSHFFDKIEKEPVDVLGPAHQRLVMHCLNEVPDLPTGLREQRENRILQWMLFERDFTKRSTFIRDSEIPKGVLNCALRASGDKTVFLDALSRSQGHLSDATMAALIGLFKDEDRNVRSSAANALGSQSTLSDATIAALVEFFKDEDSYVRWSAANTLGNQSTLSDATIAALMGLFKDEDSDVRWSAARAIGSQSTLSDATIATLVELFKDKDSDVRWSAANTLGNQSTLSDVTIAALMGLFKDEDSDIRWSAARAIGSQSTLSDATIATLVELFKDKDRNVRKSTTNALGKQSTLSDATVAALVELLKDEDWHVRSSAADALSKQSTLSDATIAALVELFQGEGWHVRFSAANALGKQSTLSDTTIAALIELFKNEESSVRWSAADALGNQSTLSDITMVALVELLKDESRSVRWSAADALGNQSKLSDTTIAALVELLKDEDCSIRRSAANALGNQSTLSDVTITALVELFKDEDSNVQSSAADALGNQSTLSDVTIAALVELLKDEDSNVRESAADALGKQSTLSDATMVALVELLKDEDRSVRWSAARAIGNQSALSDKILDALAIRVQPEGHALSVPGQLRCSEDIESFYESFLQRSFREHFSLYADENICMVNEGSALRKATLQDQGQFQEAIRRARAQLDTQSYSLWSAPT
ncbi:peptidaseCc14 [Colletotrichum musicola]|uniref:PeptidaseCc14 n=1 Tax=Colletotrichum musicola TaxID=2175873 RepID=A0A8H6MU49_9PEZI|nr:peptidaseCc14 [Colletotrichum musicola]